MLIEIYADIACPWCYIGERRLERALAERPGLRVERQWRPFQLQPDLPPGGLPWAEFSRTKFGGDERAQAAFAAVAQHGAGEGIDFRFDRMSTAANTANGHRLILFAARRGLEWPMVEALFAAHFTHGRDLSDDEQLVALAVEAGLPEATTRDYLASDEGMAEALASQAEARYLGITGVPFFIFDRRFGLSGAQPLAVFRQALDLAASPVEPSSHQEGDRL